MDSREIGLDLASKEREDIFDDYYRKIESIKLEWLRGENTPNPPNYEKVKLALTILERNLDDVISTEGLLEDDVLVVERIVKDLLEKWFSLFAVLLKGSVFLDAFSQTLLIAANLVVNVRTIGYLELRKIFMRLGYIHELSSQKIASQSITDLDVPGEVEASNIKTLELPEDLEEYARYIQKIRDELDEFLRTEVDPSRRRKSLRDNNPIRFAKEMIDRYQSREFAMFDEVFEHADREEYAREVNNSFKIIKKAESLLYLKDNEIAIWTIDIRIVSSILPAAQVGYQMFSFASSLESIDGVEVTLESWRNGSKEYTLNTRFNDQVSKEEAKDVLGKSRARLTKEKSGDGEDVNLKSDFNEHVNDEKDRLDIEERKINIKLKKVELIERVSELIANGLENVDSDIQILINNMLYCEILGAEVKDGVNIDIIEQNELRMDTDSNDKVE